MIIVNAGGVDAQIPTEDIERVESWFREQPLGVRQAIYELGGIYNLSLFRVLDSVARKAESGPGQ